MEKEYKLTYFALDSEEPTNLLFKDIHDIQYFIHDLHKKHYELQLDFTYLLACEDKNQKICKIEIVPNLNILGCNFVKSRKSVWTLNKKFHLHEYKNVIEANEVKTLMKQDSKLCR